MEPLEKILSIRVNDKLRLDVEEAAAKREIKMAQFVREAIRNEIKRKA